MNIQENYQSLQNLIEDPAQSEVIDEFAKLQKNLSPLNQNKSFLDFTISGCLLKDGKLNEAIYFYQSGSKSSKIPTKLRKHFPEFTANKALLV